MPSGPGPPRSAARRAGFLYHSGPCRPGKGRVMRRRVLIIVNPAAGGTRSGARRLRRVVVALERRGCTVVLRHASARAGDVERLAREAEPDFEAIVAAGGDGTVNAVVNGL